MKLAVCMKISQLIKFANSGENPDVFPLTFIFKSIYFLKSLYFWVIYSDLSLLPVRQRVFSHTTRKPARIPRLLDHPAAVQRAVALGAGFGHHLWGEALSLLNLFCKR